MAEGSKHSRSCTNQTSVVCDGCEDVCGVHSFCLNCHGNLCNTCKTKHSNYRLTRNHKVLPRGHPSVIKAKNARSKGNITCRRHAEHYYVTYCIKCNIPCCAKCMIEGHAEHDVTDFDDVGQDVQNALTQYRECLETEVLLQSLHITKELHQRRSTSKEQIQNNKEEVCQRVSDLLKKLADLGKETEDKLDDMYDAEEAVLNEQIRTSEQHTERITELVKDCKQCIHRANAAEMSLMLSESPDDLTTLLPKITLPAATVLNVSNYDLPYTEEIIGKTERGKGAVLFDPGKSKSKLLKLNIRDEVSLDNAVASSAPVCESFNPDMIQTSKDGEFTTNIRPYSMARTDDDDVWINGEGGSLALYDETGNQKHTMAMEFDINAITLTKSRDIIATDDSNKRIVRISNSGDLTSLRSTSPLYAGGICINDRQQLVVGLCKGWTVQPIKLVVYSADGGSVIQEMEKGVDGEALFKIKINRVRQNGKGEYVVLDGVELVCLTSTGSMRWTHSGNIVWDVECDRYCNVIFCDDDGVTMLDREGNQIKQLLTTEGIVLPRSISLDRQERLWIGLKDACIQIWSYLK